MSEVIANWSEEADDYCAFCGEKLPKDPRPGSVQELGYCSVRCKKYDEMRDISYDKSER